MAGDKRPIVYWDSCIFIAYLKNEEPPQRTFEEVDGIEESVALFDQDDIHIATSVISLTEILTADVNEDMKRRFKLMTLRPNFQMVDVVKPIALIANEIREYYQFQKEIDGAPTIETPDALHMATAIWLNKTAKRLQVIYTFDGCRETVPKKNKKRGMIPLSGNIAGKYSLIIKTPAPKDGPNLFSYSTLAADTEDDYEDDTDE